MSDEGPLPPHPIDGIKYNMETVDEVIRDKTIAFIDQAKGDGSWGTRRSVTNWRDGPW